MPGPEADSRNRAVYHAVLRLGRRAPLAIVIALGVAVAAEENDPDLEVEVPELTRFGADVRAKSERVTFALGSLALRFDTLAERPQLAGTAQGRYQRGLETPSLGYSADLGFVLAGEAQDRDLDASDTSSLLLGGAASGLTEARFYLKPSNGLFAHGQAGLTLAAQAVTVETAMAGRSDLKQLTPSLDISLGLGIGYGRVLDAGSRLRLARIETVLRRARLQGQPVSAEIAARVQTAWWEARSELGSWRRLKATLQILRQSGVLLTEPDPLTAYQIVRILEDGQLDERLQGWDARLGVGELFLGRDNYRNMDDDFELDREEVVFARGRLGGQLAGDSELGLTFSSIYGLTGDPTGMLAAADLTWRKYFYGAAWDPQGALELGASLAVSDRDTDDEVDAATRASATIGYSIFPNRASRFTVKGEASLEGDVLFLGIRAEGTFAIMPASYAAW